MASSNKSFSAHDRVLIEWALEEVSADNPLEQPEFDFCSRIAVSECVVVFQSGLGEQAVADAKKPVDVLKRLRLSHVLETSLVLTSQ
ncbi:hypothetical protein E4U32_001549 [Claviceps aff. humidiphila group G2b]|nr:hypothetical protein E4U32_001549 [Claviceps aff. humidiphila group G2b]